MVIFKDVTDEYENREFGGFTFTTEEINFLDPVTFTEARDRPEQGEHKGWRESIRKEVNEIIKHKVWRRVKCSQISSNRRTIGSKWVF